MYSSSHIRDAIAAYRVETLDPMVFSIQSEYWKATKKRCLLVLTFSVVSSLLFILSGNYPSGSYESLFFGMCAILCVIIVAAIIAYTHTRYTLFQKRISSTLIRDSIAFIHPDAHVIDKWFISQRDFNESDLFYITPDTYSGNSLVDCFIDDIHVRFSFISASYFLKRHTFRISSFQSVPLFNGVCAVFTLSTPQHVNYYCITRGNNLLSADTSRFVTVTHSTADFNDNYTLLASSAQYNKELCNKFADFVLDIEEETGISCMLSVIGRKVFIAFPDARLFFSTSFSGQFRYNRAVDKYLFILNRILQFAYDFTASEVITKDSK